MVIFEHLMLVHRSNVQLILTDLACITQNITLKQVLMFLDHTKKFPTFKVVQSKSIKLSSSIQHLLDCQMMTGTLNQVRK